MGKMISFGLGTHDSLVRSFSLIYGDSLLYARNWVVPFYYSYPYWESES